jgi:hypothetical protein
VCTVDRELNSVGIEVLDFSGRVASNTGPPGPTSGPPPGPTSGPPPGPTSGPVPPVEEEAKGSRFTSDDTTDGPVTTEEMVDNIATCTTLQSEIIILLSFNSENFLSTNVNEFIFISASSTRTPM